MAADGKTFKANVTKWAKQFNVNLEGLARQSCYELSYRVILDTPVDVGFLRGSWQPSLNSPSSASGGSGAPEVALSATLTGIKLGDTFWMTNNAAYALRLEYGFVGPDKLGRVYNQAGRYYVTSNMKKWDAIVQDVAKQLAGQA
jgi:hypothetical protein